MSLVAPVLLHAQSAPRIDWNGERLSVSAERVPLDALLRELAMRTGSRIVGLEHAAELVTVDIRDAFLLDGVRQLLGHTGVNYLYMPRESVGGAERVVLWLYGATAPRPGALREAIVVDAAEATAADLPVVGYAPVVPETEVARLHREGAFDVHASQASLIGLATSPDPEVRILALQTLALQPTAATAETLRAALRDENIFVRGEAMVLIGSLGQGKDAVNALSGFIHHDDPEVRGVAAMSLGEQAGDEAESLLRRALNDEDGAVRGFAAQSLKQKAASEKPKR